MPILCVALLKHHGGHGEEKRGLFDRFLKVYRKAVSWFVRLRWFVVPGYLAACGLILCCWGCDIEMFPLRRIGWRNHHDGCRDRRSVPSCSPRSTRGNSCSGSGRRPARTSS